MNGSLKYASKKGRVKIKYTTKFIYLIKNIAYQSEHILEEYVLKEDTH